MDTKFFLSKAQKSAGSGFAFSKIWKMQALQEIATSLNLDVLNDSKKVRRVLRKIRDSFISGMDKENVTEKDYKEFLLFMDEFFESGITCFEPRAILSGTTISAAQKGDEKAKLEVERAERVLKKVAKYLEKSKVTEKKK